MSSTNVPVGNKIYLAKIKFLFLFHRKLTEMILVCALPITQTQFVFSMVQNNILLSIGVQLYLSLQPGLWGLLMDHQNGATQGVRSPGCLGLR